MIAATLIAMSISKPLKDMLEVIKNAKEGDLTNSIIDDSKDEIGKVISGFNDMVIKMRDVIVDVKNYFCCIKWY